MKKITLGITFLLISCFAFTQIINIPADYPTIQEGINAASDGDTVLVQPDTYYENINFFGKNITVGSLYLTTADTNYISQTIIDGSQNGSVVLFENGETADAILIGFIITNGNSETSGGGIVCVFSSPHLESLVIVDNYALYNGGAIICGAMANPTLLDVIISDNEAGNDGGGLYCFNFCSPSLSNVMISSNTAYHGGGVCLLGNSSPVLEEVMITNNEANKGGGIFSGPECNFELNNVAVEDNTADTDGGGIFMVENSPIIRETMINDNYASRGGGVFAENLAVLSLDYSSVSGNEATERGAGIYAYNIWLYIDSCELHENEVYGDQGGAVYYRVAGTPDVYGAEVTNTSISYNIGPNAANYAGMVFRKPDDFPGFNVLIEKCVFNNNSGNAYSGLCIRGIDIEFEVIDCAFTNNIAESYTAGAGFTNGARGDLYNCLFAANDANTGGGEWNSGGATVWGGADVNFYNCTFADNTAYSGTAVALGASEAKLVNCIVWGNSGNQISLFDFNDTGSSLLIAYSDIQNGESGVEVGELSELNWMEGNIDEDPVFYGTGDHPYSLDMGSPCIEDGTPDSLEIELPETDCMGNFRVWDGDDNGHAVVDMGPYEYGSTPVGMEEWMVTEGDGLLLKVYPNPFTISTNIEYTLFQTCNVTIAFYNQFGKEVDRIEQKQPAGKQHIEWGPDLPCGIYYFKLSSGEEVITGKIILVR